MEPKTIVLYHGNCPDGFGGAYAAWKKFGDTATYIPVSHSRPAPEGLAGNDVYLIDFSYPQEAMDAILREAASFTVLDHHEGVAEVVESVPNHVYDAARSGTTIAWGYFHPEVVVPKFLSIVADADLYKPLTDDERAIISYIYVQPFTFENWDAFVATIDTDKGYAEIAAKGRTYTEHFKLLVAQVGTRAERVRFEGHEVYFVSAPRLFATELGSQLLEKLPPLVLIGRVQANGDLRISMRGKGIDVSEIARKYGGNGHPGSAAFTLAYGTPLPWKVIDENENPGD